MHVVLAFSYLNETVHQQFDKLKVLFACKVNVNG